jgi:hypothetical protein
MLPFGVTIPATVPQGSEIPEGLMNIPVYKVNAHAYHRGHTVKGYEHMNRFKYS